VQSCLNLFTVSHMNSRLRRGTKTKGMGETPLAAALQPPQMISSWYFGIRFFSFFDTMHSKHTKAQDERQEG